MSPLVRINTDSAATISELHGIGPHLAARIVEYRNIYGPFAGPSDLDKVEGIGLGLAETLAPHIDWATPVDEAELPGRGTAHWLAAFISMIFVTLSSYGAYLFIQLAGEKLSHDTSNFGLGLLLTWVWLLISFPLTFVLSGIFWLCLVVRVLILRPPIQSAVSTVMAVCWTLAFLTGFSQLVIIVALMVTFSINPSRILTIYYVPVTLIVLLTAPLTFKSLSPRLFSTRLIQRFFDPICWALLVLFGLLVGYTGVDNGSWWWWLGLVFISIVGLFGAVRSLRTGESFFLPLYQVFVLRLPNTSRSTNQAWLRWLNHRLPDVDSQRQLKSALDEAYPPSRIRTITSLVIISVGGWIILTSIGAVIEWFVQRWLDASPYLK